MRRTIGKAIGLSVTACLVLAACGSSKDDPKAATGGQPVNGGTLIDLANFAAGAPAAFDPALAIEVGAHQLDALLFDGLTATDSEGKAVKAVASDYSSNDDATQWTFTLRNDVLFSDGSPVLPSSFKLAWQRVLNPAFKDGNAGTLAELQLTDGDTKLDNVVANDSAHTLTVKLAKPDEDFASLVSTPQFSPMPANVPMDKSIDGTAMVGNGPFMLEAPIQSGQTVILDRNPKYYGGPDHKGPYVDKIEFRVSTDLQANYNDFAAGKGQIARFPNIATADLQKYQAENILNTPQMGVEYVGFNMADPMIGGDANVKLREAIGLALNRGQINQDVYGGTHTVATQFSSPTTPGSDAKPGDGKPDVEGAKALLKEWGKTPPPLKISYPTGGDTAKEAKVVLSSLQAVGIPAVDDGMDYDTYSNKLLAGGQLQVFFAAWTADYSAYRSMIESSFRSGSSDNLTGYSNSKVDGLFTDAQTEHSEDKRQAFYRDAEKQIMTDMPVVPFLWDSANFIKDPKVRNMKADAFAYVNYDELWLAP